MSREKQIEEMKTAVNNYFDNTPMELSFKHENGDTDIITDEKALGVIDAITRQALIPVFCEALYNAGYRKQSEWISVEDRLPDGNEAIIVTDGKKIIVAYRNWLYRSNSTGKLRCPANYGNGMYVTHWMPLPEAPKGGE